MGRPPLGSGHADRVDASEYARQRLRWIFATIAGEATVEEACRALGIGESRFHELRERAVAGAAVSLEPRARGRPRREEAVSAADVEALQAKVAALEQEVVVERTRAALARDLPHLLRERGEKEAVRPEASVAGRGGRRTARGRTVVRPEGSRADEPDA